MKRALIEKGHVVIVVAEGAGTHLMGKGELVFVSH